MERPDFGCCREREPSTGGALRWSRGIPRAAERDVGRQASSLARRRFRSGASSTRRSQDDAATSGAARGRGRTRDRCARSLGRSRRGIPRYPDRHRWGRAGGTRLRESRADRRIGTLRIRLGRERTRFRNGGRRYEVVAGRATARPRTGSPGAIGRVVRTGGLCEGPMDPRRVGQGSRRPRPRSGKRAQDIESRDRRCAWGVAAMLPDRRNIGASAPAAGAASEEAHPDPGCGRSLRRPWAAPCPIWSADFRSEVSDTGARASDVVTVPRTAASLAPGQ